MEWENITRIVKKVEEYTKALQDENREVQKRCERYTKVLKEDLATPESVSQINEQLQKIEEDLNDVLEKANDKVFIEFVGATSSGKSSLINALLREERLPVGFEEAAMGLIEICTTEDDDWKVEINDTHLSSGRDKEAVKDLLNAMIGDKLRKKREKMGINEDSKVRVYWPARLSRKVLPDNIVLVDTPGFGDDEEKSDQIVSDSCRKADIIVAVMDVMSPSKAYVSKNVLVYFS